MTFVLVAATVIASPLVTTSSAVDFSQHQVASVDISGQVHTGNSAADSLVTGVVAESVTVSTMRTNLVFGPNLTDVSHEGLGSNSQLDSLSDTIPTLKKVEYGRALEDISDHSKSDRYISDKLDRILMGQSANIKLARDSVGYHNYALVCADSKLHTDYCMSGRRGYYCSQNGYVMLKVVSHPYTP